MQPSVRQRFVASTTRYPWRGRPIWWFEIALIAGCYWLYALVRDAHGRDEHQSVAYAHGHDVQRLESNLGLEFEHSVQQFFLHARSLLHVMGGFYGGAHFLVTFGVLGWLLWKRPDVYRRWRRILGLTTATAVALFALYPTAPPRLIPGTGLQDTLETVGGLWSYNHGVVEHISDPYAAMPSLHLGWSTWVALTLASTVGANWARWKRWLFALYPATVMVIVVATGTHWFLDTVAGSAVTMGVWAADRSAPRVWAEAKARLRPAVTAQQSVVRRRNSPESASID